MITDNDLYDISEIGDNSDKQKIALYLFEAMNDWPDWLGLAEEEITINTYFNGIRRLIENNIITRTNVQAALDKLNPAKDAWYMESLSGLMPVFDLIKDEEITVNVIEEVLK